VALLETLEEAHSTPPFGGFAAFGFGFAFASWGFPGRGALLSNEHAIDFDAGPLSPAGCPSRARSRTKFGLKAAQSAKKAV
jgi:hypothetical protein